jgi:hypothetical protein
MITKDEHLRAAAAEAFAHMPLDYHDTLKVLEHLRDLADWRWTGVFLKEPKPASITRIK